MDHGNHHNHHKDANKASDSSYPVHKAMEGRHEGHSIEIFKSKFWLSLVLSIVVVFYSDVLQRLFGFRAPGFPGSQYIPLLLGSVVFFYGGWVFIQGAYRELKARQPGMMTLIAMAISVAYLYSLYSVVVAQGETLFWELTTLITIMLLGHWMEMRAVQGAQGALKELAKLLPDTTERIKNYESGIKARAQLETEIIPLQELKEYDVVLVKPGGKIAADGRIVEGKSEINESMVTGESMPVAKEEGDQVIAGSINGNGSLKIRVDKIGENTFLAGIMKLVAQAQSSKSRLQILSDRAAFYLTIIALVSASLTFVIWLLNKSGINFALERTVAVLVVACPHALGLAIPLVASISTDIAAKNGLLVKQRLALEAARNVNVVIFDKTGTLTQGKPEVTEIIPLEGLAKRDILIIAASLEMGSEHSLAESIVSLAHTEKVSLPGVQNFHAIPGYGVEGTFNYKRVTLGNRKLMANNKIDISGIEPQITNLENQGNTVMILGLNGKPAGLIAVSDTVKDSAKKAVDSLQKLGIEVIMISGDNQRTSKAVADQLGIKNFIAEVLPQDKAKVVKDLQEGNVGNCPPEADSPWAEKLSLEIGNSRQRRVAMVGDGINDAPALAQADLGIAIGAGTNVAIESAGIILVRNDPRDVLKIIGLSRLTYSKMVQNLFWATGYNVVALPLAAGVLASKGVLMQPALAAVFMSLSTVIVALNAVMLRRKSLK